MTMPPRQSRLPVSSATSSSRSSRGGAVNSSSLQELLQKPLLLPISRILSVNTFSEMSRKRIKMKPNKYSGGTMIKSIVRMTLILCLIFPVAAFAGIPLQTVKGNVDKVLDVLRDPSLKAESSKKVKKDKIRAISKEMFDFTELSKRTLAQNWSKFSPGQQKEFTDLYTSVLEDAYANKIIAYTDEKIDFGKEVPLAGNTFEVQSTVLRKNGDVQIFYRVI